MKMLSFLCRSVINTAIVGWAVMFGGGQRIQAAELKVGAAAPPFELKGSDGKTYSLKDFTGKQAVVLAWFPKAFTGGCTIECKNFQTDSAKIKKYDVAYFTASVDKPEDNAKFAESLGVKDYAILADPSREVAKAYGVVDSDKGYAKRWTFYIDKDGKIAAIDKGVNVTTHATTVGEKLKELGVPEKKVVKD